MLLLLVDHADCISFCLPLQVLECFELFLESFVGFIQSANGLLVGEQQSLGGLRVNLLGYVPVFEVQEDPFDEPPDGASQHLAEPILYF